MAKMTCVASRMLLAEPTGWNLPTVNLALAKLVEVGAIKEGDRQAGGVQVWILPHRQPF